MAERYVATVRTIAPRALKDTSVYPKDSLPKLVLFPDTSTSDFVFVTMMKPARILIVGQVSKQLIVREILCDVDLRFFANGAISELVNLSAYEDMV